MKFGEFRRLVFADLYRVDGKTGWAAVFRELLLGEEGFCYCFWMRACRYTRAGFLKRLVLHLPARLLLRHFRYRYGIWIPPETEVGAGLYIGHFGGIIVSPRAVVGTNVNLSHGVTLGKANRGKRKGYPTVGNGVFLGPGAVVSGNLRVGDGAAVGANCVVVEDVPEGAVVAGVPGKVVSMAGAEGYVGRTDWDVVLGEKDA